MQLSRGRQMEDSVDTWLPRLWEKWPSLRVPQVAEGILTKFPERFGALLQFVLSGRGHRVLQIFST